MKIVNKNVIENNNDITDLQNIDISNVENVKGVELGNIQNNEENKEISELMQDLEKDNYNNFLDKLYKLLELNNSFLKKDESENRLKVIAAIKLLFKLTGNTHIYIKSVSKYYWIEGKTFLDTQALCNNLSIGVSSLYNLRRMGVIKTYDRISYFDGQEEGVYNLFDKNTLLKPSDTPILDENIKLLIENICNFKEESIEYLHKAILYKYTHLNDVRVPAIVFYGAGGSGKGTFINFLAQIFGKENTLQNLGKQELTNYFTPIKGDKLIISFDEIVTNNTSEDTNITNKLKNFIFAESITVNQKYVNMYQTRNIAWFFISSNNTTPIKLDDPSVGNRRFSIIYSDKKLENTKKIYDSINNKQIVSNYLAWLFTNYGDIKDSNGIEALENEDKKDLEFASQNESNLFWNWFEETYPHEYGKVNKTVIEKAISVYLNSNEEIDKKEFNKYFWKNSRYMKKRFRVDGKLIYGVILQKNEQLLKEKEDEIKLKKEKDEEILRKIGLQDSNIHGVNENGKVVEYSVDEGEKELEISFDFSNDL